MKILQGNNPIDYLTVSNIPGIKPLPHIPGVEITEVIEKVGNHVATLNEGDKVVVYNVIFDGTCDMCLNGYEMLCTNAGILGVITNGGFADYISASEKNVFKIPDNVQWDVAASLALITLMIFYFFTILTCLKLAPSSASSEIRIYWFANA